MLTCLMVICLWQTPSIVPDRTNFTFVDMETGETLKVEWLTPEVTKNTEGDTCWLYDGETMSDCEEEVVSGV